MVGDNYCSASSLIKEFPVNYNKCYEISTVFDAEKMVNGNNDHFIIKEVEGSNLRSFQMYLTMSSCGLTDEPTLLEDCINYASLDSYLYNYKITEGTLNDTTTNTATSSVLLVVSFFVALLL
ncbi:hypothetical protein EIN_417030 [Entamoeba invadens IP1]|uniref:Uncharacterized protein n=1 Tax=Entamoeba invadens IP1 TaxID=370355 RepID=A0A0A1TYM6_ENTIV|nr:hypothetical protein EIN_417030 [Entamoeba invadens IP1]ELP83624.1 hypothetical protein EIN_417030 [Entamoeba invadens IP1]|eukprot:XP_004182970.1 hypothetical protein EIN_417030 [Entamoeba invadens IP1]